MKRFPLPRLEGISLKRRDRRALKLCAFVLGPVLFFTHGVRPYLGASADLLGRLETERASYERELRLLADSGRFPALRRQAEKSLERETGRLFEGPNDASAGAALAAFVEARARESEVHFQGVQTLATDSVEGGLWRLQVQVQALSDLEGVLRFLAALEGGDKLVSVEELRIERREGFSASPPVAAQTVPATRSALTAAVPGGADPPDVHTVHEAAPSPPTVLSISAIVAGYTTTPAPTAEPGDRPLAARDR